MLNLMSSFCICARKRSLQMLISWVYFRSLAVVSFTSIILAMLCAYFHAFPWFRPLVHNDQTILSSTPISKCNVFEGRWVPDSSYYPLYQIPQCPFVDPEFNCLGNGKKNKWYLNWRWKPKDCDIPRFNARRALEKLRGKRVVFVGDSLSRQQWSSLICMLLTGVEHTKSVYVINEKRNAEGIMFSCVLFSSFDLRVDFYKSIFLVQFGFVPKHAPEWVNSTIRLDKFDDISNEWIDSDILIFNSAHWWINRKLFDIGQDRKSCIVTEHPLSRTTGKERNLFSDIIIDVVKKMTIPVNVLHVTPMGAFRTDAMVYIWSGSSKLDCEHWCLPGVPDMWNEILLSYYNVT